MTAIPIGPKNTNLAEDIDILIPVKIRWILFGDFKGEVKNVSVNQIPGRSSWLSNRLEKKPLAWQRTSRPCFLSSNVEFYSVVSEEKSKMSQPIRDQGGHLDFLIGPKTLAWQRTLIPCFLSSFVEFLSAVSEEKSKTSQPIRDQGGHLDFPIGPKNTNMAEDIETLLPVKFRWIPLSGFRGEVENVSAHQRQKRPSCFSDRPEKSQTW